jgi:hypothetical protein
LKLNSHFPLSTTSKPLFNSRFIFIVYPTESKHSNRQQKAAEKDDVTSIAGESSPRGDAVSK